MWDGIYGAPAAVGLCLPWAEAAGVQALQCCGWTWEVQAAFGWVTTSPATDPPVLLQGNCYVWNLTGGIGEEVTQLIPKTKIPAHNRYALQCKFSPDST